MGDQAEGAFLRGVYLNTLTSQPIVYKDDYQQPPENSLKKVPVLQVGAPPTPTPPPNPNFSYIAIEPNAPDITQAPVFSPVPAIRHCTKSLSVDHPPSCVVFCVAQFRLHHLELHLGLRIQPPQPDPLPRLPSNDEDKDTPDFTVSSSPPFAYATARPRTRFEQRFSAFAPPSSTSGSSNRHSGRLTLARLPQPARRGSHVRLIDGRYNQGLPFASGLDAALTS
ncbi:hypothetical protein B0H14DRAFT_3639761 [Mycena olivaceomarginata]|nr:hypothetical protein B0H14DRAFT_3639761 [Mycena olivaceomarginata]